MECSRKINHFNGLKLNSVSKSPLGEEVQENHSQCPENLFYHQFKSEEVYSTIIKYLFSFHKIKFYSYYYPFFDELKITRYGYYCYFF